MKCALLLLPLLAFVAGSDAAGADPSCPTHWIASKPGIEGATELVEVKGGMLFLELDRSMGDSSSREG